MLISYCYDNQAKMSHANLLHKQLALVAKAMGLKAKQYDLRFNEGGVTVWGEVTLHTDTHYIQASKSYRDLVLVRACKDRKDCEGGVKRYLHLNLLLSDPAAFAQQVEEITEKSASGKAA
jgi:hypothetical protein